MFTPIRHSRSGSSVTSAMPSMAAPRSSSYVVPSSTRHVIRGSRRRLTAFWLFAFVSKQTSPSMSAYHIATRCGWPSPPIVAIVIVRLPASSCWTSSSVRTMSARWLTPTAGSALAVEELAHPLDGGDAPLDQVEHDLLRRPDSVHPPDDLPDREPRELPVVRTADPPGHLAVQDSLQRHGQCLRCVF